MILGPFECEPEVGVFGDLGKRMAELIREIAIQLKMNDHAWPYAGAFVINATRVVHAARCSPRSAIRRTGRRPSGGLCGGNLGALNATISRSAGITLLRDLGKTVHLIEQLSELVQGALGPSSTFLSDCGQPSSGRNGSSLSEGIFLRCGQGGYRSSSRPAGSRCSSCCAPRARA